MYGAILPLLLNNIPIRTKLIDDAKGPNPQYRGLIHGTTQIVKQEGIRGIYRGLFPVVSCCCRFLAMEIEIFM